MILEIKSVYRTRRLFSILLLSLGLMVAAYQGALAQLADQRICYPRQ
jgi:hypothetical protein